MYALHVSTQAGVSRYGSLHLLRAGTINNTCTVYMPSDLHFIFAYSSRHHELTRALVLLASEIQRFLHETDHGKTAALGCCAAKVLPYSLASTTAYHEDPSASTAASMRCRC
jgi:hypothetical protein